MSSPALPGRLGDPTMSLSTEPRLHPGQKRALDRLGLSQNSYLTSDLRADSSPHESVRAFILQNESSLESLYNSLDFTVPSWPHTQPLTETSDVIHGPDGNQIVLTTFRPTSTLSTPIPGVVYFHGGGMIMLSALNPKHTSWARCLAQLGLAVVLVAFRNALGTFNDPPLDAPFPAGLRDCAAAARAISLSRSERRITRLVLQGESGGGNLAIATAILAGREGWAAEIAGVCACAPYISGAYGRPEGWRRAELPSTVECDGYLIEAGTGAMNARMYDPSGRHGEDPLAWPFWAGDGDLRGLPPHLVIVGELDPLRDEGVRFVRKLLEAGVRAVGKVNLGIVHEGENFLRREVPDVFLSCLMDIKGFVEHIC